MLLVPEALLTWAFEKPAVETMEVSKQKVQSRSGAYGTMCDHKYAVARIVLRTCIFSLGTCPRFEAAWYEKQMFICNGSRV